MRYPGGKGKCFQQLINLMPPHRVYIESHLGGGAVLRHKRSAEISIGIDIDPKVIERWNKTHSKDCILLQTDATDYLANYPYTGNELIYADPPYLPFVRRRTKVYRYDYTEEDHIKLLEILKQVKCMVMISGYQSLLYEEALSQWRKVSFMAKTHTDVREECVWMNFDPPQQLHDVSYLGHTFRDRQTIKRRQSRIMERFTTMDPIERHGLLNLLNAQYNFSSEST